MTDIANAYGQALYDLARDEGLAEELMGELTVLKECFKAEPDFVRLLGDPSIPKQERCKVLEDSFGGKVHAYLLNFLRILTEKGYMGHFPGCCELFARQYDKDNGILTATAVTALPLSDELRQRLTDKLSAVTGKSIRLECRVDERCLGGIRLELEGMQLDDTVRHRLDQLRNILKNTVL